MRSQNGQIHLPLSIPNLLDWKLSMQIPSIRHLYSALWIKLVEPSTGLGTRQAGMVRWDSISCLLDWKLIQQLLLLPNWEKNRKLGFDSGFPSGAWRGQNWECQVHLGRLVLTTDSYSCSFCYLFLFSWLHTNPRSFHELLNATVYLLWISPP